MSKCEGFTLTPTIQEHLIESDEMGKKQITSTQK